MEHTIQVMEHKEFDDGGNELTGYAFKDENGHCFIIIYGDKKRDLIERYLKNK